MKKKQSGGNEEKQSVEVPEIHPIQDSLIKSYRNIEDLYARKKTIAGIPTGFEQFDDITSGLQNSELIIVAGRPSMGKTSFALNIAQFVALEINMPVGIFSLEMSQEQMSLRMISSEAKIDSQRLRKGFLGETDWPKLTTAVGRLSEAPIYFIDTPNIHIRNFVAHARLLKAIKDVKLIIVDYIQLMQPERYLDTREQEIAEISRLLKAVAMELNIPIIALSQLNRKVEDRPNRRPQMGDLRDSGAIEQDADVIAFIYRDEVYNKSDENPNKGVAEIIIGKQRNGPTGAVKLAFLNKFTCFENLARPDGHVQ